MIVGDRKRFAIEYELDNEYGGAWLFGKICYWVFDRCIGNYDLGTSLRDVLFQMTLIIKDSGKRMNDDLFALKANDLYRRLNEALYGTKAESSKYDQLAIEQTWARFDVTMPVDVFDGCKIFLIENQEKSRLIIKQLNREGISEDILTKGEFDK